MIKRVDERKDFQNFDIHSVFMIRTRKIRYSRSVTQTIFFSSDGWQTNQHSRTQTLFHEYKSRYIDSLWYRFTRPDFDGCLLITGDLCRRNRRNVRYNRDRWLIVNHIIITNSSIIYMSYCYTIFFPRFILKSRKRIDVHMGPGNRVCNGKVRMSDFSK